MRKQIGKETYDLFWRPYNQHSTSTTKVPIKREISYQDFTLEFKLFMTEEAKRAQKYRQHRALSLTCYLQNLLFHATRNFIIMTTRASDMTLP
jgi:hypothetical protein